MRKRPESHAEYPQVIQWITLLTTYAGITLGLLAFSTAGCGSSARVATLAASPVRKPADVGRPSYPALKIGIDSMLADSLFPPGNVGIKIVSLSTHEVLYDQNSQNLFNPASNQKLFTSAAALASLGESYPLATVVCVDTAGSTLFIKGFGDPLLQTEDIDSIARTIAPRLPQRDTWKLVYDLSYFDDLTWGHGWAWDDEPDVTQPHITPLALNGNAIAVRVGPGRSAGESLRISIEPSTSYISLENSGKTVLDSALHPLTISRQWRERSNVVTVEGEMVKGSREAKQRLSVWQPGLYVATVFAEKLKANRITIGRIEGDTLNAGAMELFRYTHRLDSAVVYMNKTSDNLAAEALVKVLAAERRGEPGTSAAGIELLLEFLAAKGMDTTQFKVVDGSGMSRYNLTTASVIIDLLQQMYADTLHFNPFYSSLPIAGVDGTLAGRMRGTAAEGNLRAKTGTETGICSLSGYVRTADGELLAFSMLMQGFPRTVQPYRQVQDRIGAFLADFSRNPF